MNSFNWIYAVAIVVMIVTAMVTGCINKQTELFVKGGYCTVPYTNDVWVKCEQIKPIQR